MFRERTLEQLRQLSTDLGRAYDSIGKAERALLYLSELGWLTKQDAIEALREVRVEVLRVLVWSDDRIESEELALERR